VRAERNEQSALSAELPSVKDVATLVALIDHESLPESLRRRVRVAASRISESPGWVLEELAAIAADYSAALNYFRPDRDLYRCVPVPTVQRHMASDEWALISPLAYIQRAMSWDDPGQFVRTTIPAGTVVFPSARSWLIDAPSLPRLTSEELVAHLELRPDRRPPFALFWLTPAGMAREAVHIRLPNALDAAASQQPQWSPAGLTVGTEYVDRDVTIEAIEEILWKP